MSDVKFTEGRSESHEPLLDSWGRKNNRKIKDKECESCGVVYRPKTKTSRFCSRPCLWSKNGGQNKKQEYWWKNSNGYIEGNVWIDETTKIRVKQHRWVMEKHLGYKLDPNDDVHHINGVKDDNRLENLEVMPHGMHTSEHNTERDYKSGYKLDISDEERASRSERIREVKPWLAKARGEK